jgi:hypothetical protein
MGNYKCRRCGRYVREEEQTAEMKKRKVCIMCVLNLNEIMIPSKKRFQTALDYLD